MDDTLPLPFYAKLALVLLSLVLLMGIFYYGQDIFIPLLMALLFAILLRPVVTFLTLKLHLPHVLAVMASVLLFVAVFVAVFYFISVQVTDMANDWGKIKHNLEIHFSHLQQMVRDNFNLSQREQKKLIDNATKDSMTTGKEIVGNTLISFTDVFMNLILIPIYIFLMLLYRNHFIKFLSKLFKAEHHEKLREILGQIKMSVKSYILGLMVEMVIVSVLTAIGFLIIGLKYWILLGVITGILNLIPYIGIVIAGVISIIASLTGSADLSIVVGIVIVNIVVQLIDNNVLVPLVVSSKVQINAMVSIVGIVVGGALGGFSGMFLAIPLIAILKVIFDRIAPLEPWGYLFGDDLPKTYQWHKIKLPLYSGNSNLTANLDTKVQGQVFTETTTKDVSDPSDQTK